MTTLQDLDYTLPPELIAQEPWHPRDQCRMLVYHQKVGRIADHRFDQIVDLLTPGDLLVFNDSSVLPAKLILQKPTGWRTSGLFVSERSPGHWMVLIKSRGRCRIGEIFDVIAPDGKPAGTAELLSKDADGHWMVHVTPELPPALFLNVRGHMPLPPYIERARKKSGHGTERPEDRLEYQTVYARHPGSLAAPTAGLHFTEAVLNRLTERGVRFTNITLHIGLGTFLPVTANNLADHRMHFESFSIEPAAVRLLREQRQSGGRIIAVGTTSVRAVEAAADRILAGGIDQSAISTSTDLLIAPGYQFRLCDGLITNFHLPRTTLLALVAAKIGLAQLHQCYNHAVAQRYRFFSYGDAMLIID